MRIMAFIGLLLWVPSIVSAQQDRAVIDRVTGNVPDLVTSAVDAELPAGTIIVEVVDTAGSAVAKQAIRLAVMEQSGGRDSKACVTDDAGACSFADLLTDAQHSYRVNAPFEGARYSSTPFRLDETKGQRVRVRRLPTTRDDSRVFQILGRTIIEFRDGRAHIQQEARLSNLGEETYVFPESGMPIPLPSGFKAFDAKALMTDQRLSATEEGLDISGSLPPGRVDLLWAYDIPVGGRSLSIEQSVPFATMEYQVISDFVDGMSMVVEGFQVARVHEGQDRRFLVAGMMRRPGDPPVDPLRIHISGIPGGGPLPYLAAAIAAIFVFLGIWLLFRPLDQTAVLAKVRADRRTELLNEIAELEGQQKAKSVGPGFYEHRRRELTDELAIVLRMENEGTGH